MLPQAGGQILGNVHLAVDKVLVQLKETSTVAVSENCLNYCAVYAVQFTLAN